VKFREGENVIRAVGTNDISDEIKFVYQTAKWDKPAKLLLTAIADGVEVKLVDEKGVQCLDARNFVRFALAGDGELIDNLGTSTTARKVQLYNGRAQIGIRRRGRTVISVSSEGFPTEIMATDERG
jgi:beta-galactosidase